MVSKSKLKLSLLSSYFAKLVQICYSLSKWRFTCSLNGHMTPCNDVDYWTYNWGGAWRICDFSCGTKVQWTNERLYFCVRDWSHEKTLLLWMYWLSTKSSPWNKIKGLLPLFWGPALHIPFKRFCNPSKRKGYFFVNPSKWTYIIVFNSI